MYVAKMASLLPEKLRANFLLKTFGVFKIPLLGFIGGRITHIDDNRVELTIPLNWRTRNHLGSMYFGALAAGADLAAGFLAMMRIAESGRDVRFVFKDVNGQFLKRATGDVVFTCDNGLEVTRMIQRAIETRERVEVSVPVVARVASMDPDQHVAEFVLTMSVKMAR